ncbi:TetR/AcrR family transcriptional regulator [Erythrobacter sp. NE805]|uniref:TetR/AcrR family transcriptional regulator n=1 Tax=Erythrobacter sp. NE805 TaxID=3389875 RepID=UPI00396B02F8
MVLAALWCAPSEGMKMAKTARRQAPGERREAVLDAAETLVLETGAAHLTMDAVALRAGVSKGGVLHHFPTKRDLIGAMLDRLLAVFEGDAEIIERIAGRDLKPQLHAWIRLTETPDPKVERMAAALLSAVANEPDLLSPFGVMMQQRLAQHGAHPDYPKVLAIRTALDGYWLCNAIGLKLFAENEKAAFFAALHAMVDGIDTGQASA